MSDLISRQRLIDAIDKTDWYHINEKTGKMVHGSSSDDDSWYKADDIYKVVENVPSAEPERIIHCADCKWWDRLEDGHPYGYCRACRSSTYTERWEISIYRQNRFDFYCSDAEPKEDEDDEDVG